MAVTIKDVAKAAGVSITTVSMVLNDSDYPISEKTKNKVLDIAKAMNYVPNRVAISLVTKKTNTIAIVIPDITNPFFPEIVKSISVNAEKRGYSVILFNTDHSKQYDNIARILGNQAIDGALIVDRNINNSLQKRIKNLKCKIVYIDEPTDVNTDDLYVIASNNELGGQLAAEHLIKLGHRRLACITGPEESPNSQKRLSGFVKACYEHGIEISDENVYYGNYTFESGYAGAIQIMQYKPTGIFCFNDSSAYGAIKAINDCNYKVPDDISVVGYDNLTIGKYFTPALTTIDQFSTKTGNIAANMLIDLIEGKEVVENKVFLDPELVIRDTTINISNI